MEQQAVRGGGGPAQGPDGRRSQEELERRLAPSGQEDKGEGAQHTLVSLESQAEKLGGEILTESLLGAQHFPPG